MATTQSVDRLDPATVEFFAQKFQRCEEDELIELIGKQRREELSDEASLALDRVLAARNLSAAQLAPAAAVPTSPIFTPEQEQEATDASRALWKGGLSTSCAAMLWAAS